MNTNVVVERARQRLGRVGVLLASPPTPYVDLRRQLGRIEDRGFSSAWTNEAFGGKEAMTGLALMLAATDRLVVGTGVANVWARPPAVLQAGAATLAEAYPGRLVLGVGVSYGFFAEATGQKWGSPLEIQRRYLEQMRATAGETVVPDPGFPTVVGAMGPRMVELAAELSDGALPSGMPVTHTRRTRAALGPDKLLVVGLTVIPEPDRERARARARTSPMLAMPEARTRARRALTPLGYTERDVIDLSDRLIDDTHALGSPEQIGARVREHLDAGADHVLLLPPFGGDLTARVDAVISAAWW